MARFEPCHGKNACRDNGERCLTCGRDSSEIARLRASIMDSVLTAHLNANPGS